MDKAQDLIRQLVNMSTTNLEPLDSEDRCVYLGEHKTRSREIGQKLYDLGGHEFMMYGFQNVCSYDQVELNHAWHGIGQWQC